MKHGDWKDKTVHFNGFQHKVIDFDGVDMFKIDDGKQHSSFSKKWVHKSLIVWS